MTTSTFTPLSYLQPHNAQALRDVMVGKRLSELRTPALIIDRKKFADNCEFVTRRTNEMGLEFRAHIKSHKTIEGTRMQVEAGNGVKALVTSTIPEVWGVIESDLIETGKVTDILYSLPIAEDRMEDLTDAQEKVGDKCAIRIMVDHADQILALARAHKRLHRRSKWSVFIKVDGGGKRAGAPPRSAQMKALVEAVVNEPAVEVFGFYSHFGQSYASDGLSEASQYYNGEIECVNDAAKYARTLGLQGDLVLSVGATPTAHAAVLSSDVPGGLEGRLELHAGCYCLNDLQQSATHLVDGPIGVAISVLATVVSKYADRNEAMCDAGALAVSKDTGRVKGFGKVTSHPGWNLARISQEHGTLAPEEEGAAEMRIGDKVRIMPQHACLVCACYPWYYIVDGDGDEVVDVWEPWRGW